MNFKKQLEFSVEDTLESGQLAQPKSSTVVMPVQVVEETVEEKQSEKEE
ncbi:MAG: hypothetical protein RI952_1468 [Bacteroidota bacterium]|jgi:hypothetical protein